MKSIVHIQKGQESDLYLYTVENPTRLVLLFSEATDMMVLSDETTDAVNWIFVNLQSSREKVQ